jgi:transposase
LVIDWQEDAATLREADRREKDAEVQPRVHALWLLREGHPLGATARLVGVHYVTLQTWVAWYRHGGLAEVRRHKNGGRQGRASLLSPVQTAHLAAQARAGQFRTAQDVQEWLRTTLGVSYSRGGVYSLLARLRWQPTVPRPPSLTTAPAVQEAWKKGGSPPPSGSEA